ncbi:porin [Asticcacaulis sp. EMRT-3]|uniref:porin n=1 Tax=Asticcacaulis sp. EMRT-3 TaxID=3040349 RepID=UPI0024AF8D70|nr:porin [Asticcacaulis sp. EMRT-3]MDI7775005.1 porin [Asticcacaulis sp. EMRT-3]
MRKTLFLVAAVSSAVLLTAVPALAQTSPESQAKIDALQSQVDLLKAQLAAMQAQIDGLKSPPPAPVSAPPAAPLAAAHAAASSIKVAMKNGTPSLASSDGAFTFNVHGIFQLDAATYDQSKNLGPAVMGRDLNSGTNFRRARIGFDGKLFSDFDYRILLDFGGAGAENVGHFHEAWLQYNGFKAATIRIGEFAPSVGLEDAGSANASPFLERSAASEIARGLGGGDTRIGASAFGGNARWLWAVAVTGNTASSLSTQGPFSPANHDEQLGMTARLAGVPLQGKNWLIHTGLNYSAVINPADLGDTASTRYPVQLRERPELRVDGTRLIDTGAINAQSAAATGLELGGQYGPVFVQSEAFHYQIKRLNPASGVSNPDFSGWYVEGGWSLTGERRKYNTATQAFDGITPAANFDPKSGHWGAFEVVARYATIDLDYHRNATLTADRVLGGQQDVTSLGLDWQLNPDIRFVFEGQSVKVDRINASGVQIGQNYHAFAVRTQYGF